MSHPLSLFGKIWQQHVVVPETESSPAVLYVDLHLIHEVSSPQSFTQLRDRNLGVRRPDRTLATMDHSTPTLSPGSPGGVPVMTGEQAEQIGALVKNCREFGIELFDMSDDRRGIVHVIGPELGVAQPGMTIVCGDSHTSTHGAFGALAFGIGTTEVGHVLATQCLLQRQPKPMAVNVEGNLPGGVTAKDLILATIGQIGVDGGIGHAIEYRGSTLRTMSMEGRMTVCNMTIEAGARAGLVAPDETTFAWLKDRPRAPSGNDLNVALERWQTLKSDPDAVFDKAVDVDAESLAPMITFGTNPGMVIPIDGNVPDSDDPDFRQALAYMGLEPGETLLGRAVDVVFIGSCTNSRISDLEAAAALLRDRRIATNVRMLVVPGSQAVKREAEARGLQNIFLEAGAEWRESGCSMCIAMNGDFVAPGQYAVSTSNRNFEGRQGTRARTLLASPLTAAASAVTGRICDPRELLA